MMLASTFTARSFARHPVSSAQKLLQVRVAASFSNLSAPAFRLFAALVSGSDETGRIDATNAEMVEMAGLTRGQGPDALLREISEYALLEYDTGRAGAPYAIRISILGEQLVDEVDRTARKLREARRRS